MVLVVLLERDSGVPASAAVLLTLPRGVLGGIIGVIGVEGALPPLTWWRSIASRWDRASVGVVFLLCRCPNNACVKESRTGCDKDIVV